MENSEHLTLEQSKDVLTNVIANSSITYNENGSIESVGNIPYNHLFESFRDIAVEVLKRNNLPQEGGTIPTKTVKGGSTELHVSDGLITLDIFEPGVPGYNNKTIMGLAKDTLNVPWGAHYQVKKPMSEQMESISAASFDTKLSDPKYSEGVVFLAKKLLILSR